MKRYTSTISIDPPKETTTYIVGSNLLARLHTLPEITEHAYSAFLVLTDETVKTLYADTVCASLTQLNVPVSLSVIPPGEKHKRLETLPRLLTPLFARPFSRRTALVVVGGGVITDIGGLAAALLLRGISCIMIPTTLLAQIDAAIGGKNGVDMWLDEKHMVKNMIGTIRQPTLVVTDVTTLKTLPSREIRNGLGEMVKYTIGWGEPSFADVQTVAQKRASPDEHIAAIIHRCQTLKQQVVEQDPYETRGIRQSLNLGHTIGHAVEAVWSERFSHGESVAIGLIAEAHLARRIGLLLPERVAEITSMIASLDLPTTIPKTDIADILSRMAMDKKGGTFALLLDIGKHKTGVSVPIEIVETVLSEMMV